MPLQISTRCTIQKPMQVSQQPTAWLAFANGLAHVINTKSSSWCCCQAFHFNLKSDRTSMSWRALLKPKHAQTMPNIPKQDNVLKQWPSGSAPGLLSLLRQSRRFGHRRTHPLWHAPRHSLCQVCTSPESRRGRIWIWVICSASKLWAQLNCSAGEG